MDRQDKTTESQLRAAESCSPADLPKIFPNDPRMAYVCSPQKVSARQLAITYMGRDHDDLPETIKEYARRSRDERWNEERAVFQARRIRSRQDSILEAESQVWAMMGMDFHSQRIRGLWHRWELLKDATEDALESCAAGERLFTPDLRDACRELNDLERQLSELMPTLGIPERAQKMWSGGGENRGRMLDQIRGKLASIAGGDDGGKVFELIRGAKGG